MEKELVSIIVPAYNCARFIQETIATVVAQTYSNWEMIIVNDMSKDNIQEVVSKCGDKRVKLVNLSKNSGAAVARNTGIEAANGKYIAFLDADDLWKKEKLEKQVEFLKQNQYAFSFTGYEFADETGKGNGKIVKVPAKMEYKDALKNTTIFTSTVMFDMEKIDKEQIKMPTVKSEDTATWWKILKSGYTAYGLNESLSYYRRSQGTLSSNKLEAIRRIWNLYRNVEKLNIIKSLYNFSFYAINAVRRRV